jgi:hypothetical protein
MLGVETSAVGRHAMTYLMGALAQEGSTKTTQSPLIEAFNSPQFWAAIVAAVAAITAAAISGTIATRQSKRSRQEKALEALRLQLTEFYGPIYMLRRASSSLRATLPRQTPDGSRWNLVDHIAEVKSEGRGFGEVERSAVEQILEINKKIEDVMVGKIGLIDSFPPPSTFEEFIAHSRLLRVAWEKGETHPESRRLPFPSRLDDDLEADLRIVRKRLENLTKEK